jgi:peroxiredoxin
MTMASETIAERVSVLQEGMSGQLPAEASAAFGAEQAQLDAAGVPAGIAAAGSTMPDAELLDVRGAPTTLARARDGRPAVVVFYRGAWCPYCNVALRTYQEQLVPELDRQGVALIAVSPQKPDGSLSMQEKNGLTYTVVSDAGSQIAGQLGIMTEPAPEAKRVQATLGLKLPDINADGTYGIPMPTLAVVDAAGIIRWIDVHPNYTTRSEPADILAAVAAVTG